MTRVGRVPVDSTSEAEGKATLTGSLVNVYPYGLWMPEEWLGTWGIAGFGTGASDLTTADGGLPDESLLSWLGAAGQRAARRARADGAGSARRSSWRSRLLQDPRAGVPSLLLVGIEGERPVKALQRLFVALLIEPQGAQVERGRRRSGGRSAERADTPPPPRRAGPGDRARCRRRTAACSPSGAAPLRPDRRRAPRRGGSTSAARCRG